MASNPALVTIPAAQWTKVATGAKTGWIFPLIFGSVNYVQTYRLTTDPAPTDGDYSEAVPVSQDGYEFDYSVAMDIYVSVTGSAAGKVRVDVDT